MQLSVASREAEESKAAEKELRELRREARDALSEMADQNKQLVEAYMKKKAELRKVCCCWENPAGKLGAVWNCCVLIYPERVSQQLHDQECMVPPCSLESTPTLPPFPSASILS